MIQEIERNIANGLFTKESEKTFVDKLFAKDDIDHIRSIIKKPRLTREDMLEILYMLASKEAKLVNFSEWERYVVLKYYVWVRDFTKNAEKFYEYQDFLEKKETYFFKFQNYKTFKNSSKEEWALKLTELEEKEMKLFVFSKEEIKEFDNLIKEHKEVDFVLSAETKKMFDNIMKIKEHDVKFLIDLYLNIIRTSLSVGGTGFLETLKNKFEIDYRQREQPQMKEEKGLFSLGKGGK